MSVDLLNKRPLPSQFAGQWWMPMEYTEQVESALREDMREKSALRGYMATVRELWENIPEKFAKASWAASYDTFRKHGLIKTGFCDVDYISFGSERLALLQYQKIHYRNRMAHGYAITRVEGETVMSITPHSQSLKDMGKEEFTRSKNAVLDFCRGIVGVTA